MYISDSFCNLKIVQYLADRNIWPNDIIRPNTVWPKNLSDNNSPHLYNLKEQPLIKGEISDKILAVSVSINP